MNYIDVSHNNGIIDWDKVKLNPVKIDGVFIKANEGIGSSAIDPQLINNANGAKRVGIPLSYYHFATLNSLDVVNDSVSEANLFISILKTLPLSDLPLVLDIETNKIGLTPDKVLVWINMFFETMKKSGYTNLMLYSYTPFLNTNLPTSHNLGGYKLWVAAYSNKYAIPHGWLNANLWQYSNKGVVSGIKGDVDLTKMC